MAICMKFKDKNLASLARKTKSTMSYGAGSQGTAGSALNLEVGTVYGANGEYGCYQTYCYGGVSDLSIADYAAFGIYAKWADFHGKSIIITEGVDTPGVELGFTTVQVLNTQRILIGTINTFSVGLGVLPVQGGILECDTTLFTRK